MKKALRFTLAALLLVLLPMLASAQQNTLTATTLSAAIGTSSVQTFNVASVTGITAGNTVLFIEREAMFVNAVSGTTVTVVRGYEATAGVAHPNGAVVLAGRPQWFNKYDPSGSCTLANVVASPWVNIRNSQQWLCGITGWVPGFGNGDLPPGVTAAVASAAGQITPSGPLFHITGALAITGFVLPVGFQTGNICVIPDGTFTTTTANNIALASTAVVSKTLCFTYDRNTSKFYPAY